ncbi:amino acid adenylation domain-containing protein [Streptomyces albidoflavus]
MLPTSPLYPQLPVDCPTAAWSHVRRLRLAHVSDAQDLERRFAMVAGLWPAGSPDQRLRLWCESVPAEPGSALADRMLDRELRRAIGPSGPALRAVLLQYADGSGDLVLTAHRAVLDPRSLWLVEQVVARGADPAGLVPAEAAGPRGEVRCSWRGAPSAGRLAWAAPAPETAGAAGLVEAVLPGAADGAAEVRLAVAAGLVLGRFEPGRLPAVALLTSHADRPDGVLGAFGSSSVLAVDTSGSCTAGDLIAAAREALSGSHACGGGRHGSACATIDDGAVVGVLYDLPGDRPEVVQLTQGGPWPLTLVPRRTVGGDLSLELHHGAEVDAAAARRFARHLVEAYTRLAADDRDAVAERVESFTKAEIEETLTLGRSASPLSPGLPQRVDAAFEYRAALHPGDVALVCGATSLTYRQLNEHASRLAAGLVALGVKPGTGVGICLERSTDLVATILAVLKADAVYVPMDPNHPADRLAYTVDDAGLSLVVTDLDGFPAVGGARLVPPAELFRLGGEAAAPPAPRRGPEDAAYVIYTSGSTGRPKGVVVPHQNVLALLAATADDFGLGRDDVWTLFHSTAFDFSVWEIWGALLTGARLVVVEYWVARSPDEFHSLLVNEGVTVLNQTPSAFTQLMAADQQQERELALRLVVFGGEQLDTRVLCEWFDRYPEHRCRLVNMYGITETTVHVTAQTITRHEALKGSRSVGRPLPGWHIHVLDEQGRPAPLGVAGEMYVGGAGVALEYLGRPELTAERFVASAHTGECMYRTGDRGRFLPDGRIEYLGRLDNQVKLRGFRIELDEIRTVLLDDPHVSSAAVLVTGAEGGDAARARIEAFVVLDGQQNSDWSTVLRARAARILPDYMVPASFTAVHKLPLTTNGKLDAKKLMEMATSTSSPIATSEILCESVGGDMCATLMEIWEDVLGIPVSPESNFFHLGGNSLSAIRVRSAMRARALPELSLRQLYLTPTARELAGVLEPN